MKLYVLGTGRANVVENYNNCFCIENNNEYMLIDAGGGNQILRQLKGFNIDYYNIKYAFISHNHTDHLLGMIWMVRLALQGTAMGKRRVPLHLYGSKVCLEAIKTICLITMGEKWWNNYINKALFLHEVIDGYKEEIMGLKFKFFDVLTTELHQMAFVIENKDFVFTGDVPLNNKYYNEFSNRKYLCLEAYCLEKDREENKLPLTAHNTVKEAGILASKLSPKNLILWHGEDDLDGKRKEQYIEEASEYFKGNIIVPDDLEIIEIE